MVINTKSVINIHTHAFYIYMYGNGVAKKLHFVYPCLNKKREFIVFDIWIFNFINSPCQWKNSQTIVSHFVPRLHFRVKQQSNPKVSLEHRSMGPSS